MANQPRPKSVERILQPASTKARTQNQNQQSTIVSANAQFLVPADSSLQERQPRTLKQGDTFAVFGHNGDVISGPRSPEGIYHQDTRYLSHLYLTIEGVRPMLLSSTVRDDNATMTCDLTNPDLHGQGRVDPRARSYPYSSFALFMACELLRTSL